MWEINGSVLNKILNQCATNWLNGDDIIQIKNHLDVLKTISHNGYIILKDSQDEGDIADFKAAFSGYQAIYHLNISDVIDYVWLYDYMDDTIYFKSQNYLALAKLLL